MIQFNLLPDVKQQYIKARQMKRLVTLLAVAAGSVSLFVMILMLVTVNVVQKKNLNDLNKDITKYSKELKAVPDLDKILTVQNQLNTLGGLHDDKVVTSRLFGFISQVTPVTSNITELSADYTANTMTISGEAPSLESVNIFTDSLKSTTYAVVGDSSTEDHKAFSTVVLSAFTRDKAKASFTITLNFEPTIFDSSQEIKLTVPPGIGGATIFAKTGN